MNTKLGHIFFSLIGLLYCMLAYDFSLFVSLGVGIFIFITLELIDGFGKRIPIRELMSFIVFLQLFISPLITYNYFDNQASFIMYVDQSVYVFYILPALIAFILGLNLNVTKNKSGINLKTFEFDENFQRIGKWFVITGLVFSAIASIVPPSLAFIIYLLSRLQFVGVFILLFSNNQYRLLWLIVVYINFALEIIRGGVFIELFVWGGFLYMLLELKWQSTMLKKIIVFASGIIILYFVQSFKADYREQVWENNGPERVDREEVFLDAAVNKFEEGGVFTETTNFDRFISRLNTGWILSKVMEHTPLREPFTNGELLLSDLKNVLLPRFLFPDKAITGGRANQQKFSRFTGRRLVGSTTMRIGAFADSYVNFGIVGGWICMFFLGLIFNMILGLYYKRALKNPIHYFWIPFVFAYVVRMGDFQVMLNFLFKSIILIIIINFIFVPKFNLKSNFKN